MWASNNIAFYVLFIKQNKHFKKNILNNICSRTRRAMDVPLFLQVPHSTSPPAPEGLTLGNSCKGGCSFSLPNCSTARTLSPRMLDEKQKRSIKQRRHSSSLRYQNIYPFSNHLELTWKLEAWNWQVRLKWFTSMEFYGTLPRLWGPTNPTKPLGSERKATLWNYSPEMMRWLRKSGTWTNAGDVIYRQFI